MLTDAHIRGAKPREKSYKIADGFGLTLLVKPDGSKFWRFRYRFAAVEKSLSLGRYGDVSLADARERRDAARKLLAVGKDLARNVNAKRLSCAQPSATLPKNGSRGSARLRRQRAKRAGFSTHIFTLRSAASR